MAKPQMMVVVKVHDHDELRSIQIYPVHPDSVNEKIMAASYTFRGMMTCLKFIGEYSSIIDGNLPEKCNNSEVMLPLDDELCPNGWNNTVLKFINQTTGGSTSGLSSDEDHRIEIDHPFKSLFPIIREVLEDLSTDAHWEKQEERIERYQSPAYLAYQGYEDRMFWKIQFNFLKWTMSAASSLGDIEEDQSTERVERGTRVATSSYDNIEEASREESRSKIFSSCFPYIAFLDHSAEVDITDHHHLFQNLALGDGHHHRRIKGLAKVVMGVSATASCGSSSAIVKAAYAVAFIASLIAFWLPCKWKTTTRVLTKFGAIACAAGVLATIGYDLPTEYVWVAGLAFIVPAAAVALS